MGYYSEVSITMFEKDYRDLVIKASQECLRALELIKTSYLYHKNNIITMYWSNIKWYEGYEDVDFIMNFIRSGISYNLKRIGEETCDIEEEYEDDEWELGECTEVSRSIEIWGDDVDAEEFTQDILQRCQAQHEDKAEKSDAEVESVSEEEFLKIIA